MPITPIIIVITSLLLLLSASKWMMKKKFIGGENARKTVHLGMGVICLSFPFLFNDPLPVWILAGIAVTSILGVKVTNLRSSIGLSLFSVKRLSIGELIFPIAVAWLFTLNISTEKHTAIYYTIPLLLLTLADTMGAIAGTRFGQIIYRTASGKKSIEGSLAFLITALICTFTPLFLYTEFNTLHIILIALTVALLTTALEGISGMGMDNLLIPIGSYFLLEYYTNISTPSLTLRLVCMLLLTLLLIWTRNKHHMNGGALITAALLCFISLMLGGPLCLTACLFILIRHILALKKLPQNLHHTHSIDTILAISVPAITWLTLGKKLIIEPHLGQTFFIISLAITIAMLHAGTQKIIHSETNQKKSFILKSTCMAACIASLTYPLLTNSEFLFILLTLTLICPFCSALYFKIRSRGLPSIFDWITLSTITGSSTSIIYFSYVHY